MEDVFARKTTSISEFKANPAKVIEAAGEEPIAVLVHNKPKFYALSAKAYEAILEQLENLELAELARQRLAEGDSELVEVNISDL